MLSRQMFKGIKSRLSGACVAILLLGALGLAYGSGRGAARLNRLEPSEAYIKLVNATRNYPTVTLYVDGEGCGSAPAGDYTVCTVSAGTHNLKAVGVDGSGHADSVTRTVTLEGGGSYTWTITEEG
ncbi:MAG: DUF4397 domain-containing protein [Acidobacteriota bacterium]|nr:DUF4397 domain-containing protein [Acidobacteriota bacterium]